MSARWRPMTAADFAACDAIAGVIHRDYPESAAITPERHRLYPRGCWTLDSGGTIVGYVVSHPWTERDPPALNTRLGALPDRAATHYIHDIALTPQARGAGAGSWILRRFVEIARAEGRASLSLTAVHGSAPFWMRQGFVLVDDAALDARLRTYSAQARFMERALT